MIRRAFTGNGMQDALIGPSELYVAQHMDALCKLLADVPEKNCLVAGRPRMIAGKRCEISHFRDEHSRPVDDGREAATVDERLRVLESGHVGVGDDVGLDPSMQSAVGGDSRLPPTSSAVVDNFGGMQAAAVDLGMKGIVEVVVQVAHEVDSETAWGTAAVGREHR